MKRIESIYKRLYKFYGPQGWWPGRSRLEIIVGAILTQNTAWRNVEKAIRNLRRSGTLASPSKLKQISVKNLARLIKPAGYYNVKSRRLKNFIDFLFLKHGGDLSRLSRLRTGRLREELLSVNGIGPETCDSILLYAFKKPVFVVDAYTKRIFARHNFFGEHVSYGETQNMFVENLPKSEKMYNEYHALIVRLGKEFCKTRPDCARCPIGAAALSNIACKYDS